MFFFWISISNFLEPAFDGSDEERDLKSHAIKSRNKKCTTPE
jgi:hypothetical protein